MESKIINQYESTSTYRVFDVEVDGKRYVYDEFEKKDNKDNFVDFSIQDDKGNAVTNRDILQEIFRLVDGK